MAASRLSETPTSAASAAGRSPIDPAEMSRLLTRIVGLLDSSPNRAAFYDAYLEQVLQATGGDAAAVWEAGSHREPRLLRSLGSVKPAFLSDPSADTPHARSLAAALQSSRAAWLPNSSAENTLLVAPIFEEKKVVGLLEIAFPPQQERTAVRGLLRIATELAAFAASYLHREKWQQLQSRQSLWQQLDSFVAQLHQSLDPKEVAFVLANDGKKLIGCDQCAVGLRPARSCQVGAVSGALTVEPRSPLMRTMQQLFDRVATWGETVTYHGTRDETLPPNVAAALDNYLAQSHGSALAVVPLKDERRSGADKVCGVLLTEYFERSPEPDVLRERIDALKRHAAPAVGNALRHSRLPLQWLTRPLASLHEGGPGNFLSSWAGCLAGILLAIAVLTFLRLPLRSGATGQLVPRERRVVYSPLNGKVVQLAVQHGDRVEKGQELLFVEDLETQLKVDQLFAKIGSFHQKLSFLDDQLSKNLTPKERNDALTGRIAAQYELQKAKVERNLLLAEVRNPRKAPVAAPLSGQVLTFDAKEKLVGKTVKVGDPLLRVAEVGATWEVELLLPERAVGRIRAALLQADGSEVPVDLLLSSEPNRTYTGVLTLDGLGGETIVHNDKVVLPARVRLTDRVLAAQLERMPVGVDVHARVRCGEASAGYVWFSELWDFVYERFLF